MFRFLVDARDHKHFQLQAIFEEAGIAFIGGPNDGPRGEALAQVVKTKSGADHRFVTEKEATFNDQTFNGLM